MKKHILYLAVLVIAMAAFTSCSEDGPDKGKSIFVDPTEEPSSFDKWLKSNYVDPYNIRLLYRIKDIETNFDYNVIPADLQKSKEMAIVLKHVWLEAYEEVADRKVHFIRETAPKLFHFLGSAEHNATAGTIRLGVAEGGMKITITQVNELNPANLRNQSYFKTVHHEFGHVLHQTVNYDSETFNQISAADYAPNTWQNRSPEDALQAGFITQYAGKLPDEDFVEVLANYVTLDRTEWDSYIAYAASAGDGTGADKILQKLDIVRTYMKSTWGVDIEELYIVAQRRLAEVEAMDFSNLDF